MAADADVLGAKYGSALPVGSIDLIDRAGRVYGHWTGCRIDPTLRPVRPGLHALHLGSVYQDGRAWQAVTSDGLRLAPTKSREGAAQLLLQAAAAGQGVTLTRFLGGQRD